MKVIAIVGSARKRHTYQATERFLSQLENHGDIDSEIIQLNDLTIKTCIGCQLCFEKGQEHCPLNDDLNALVEKMQSADGVIFSTPNYAFQMSGSMKVFLDRISYVFHRPEFFNKASSNIVAQGIYRGGQIVKYFNFIENALGFDVVKGCCINTLEPMEDKLLHKNNNKIDKLALRFMKQLNKQSKAKASLFDLMMFRVSRTRIKRMLDESFRDYTYYEEKGWFTSDFFYPVKLNGFKKFFGLCIDKLMTKLIK